MDPAAAARGEGFLSLIEETAVAVCIVTHNSAADLPGCFASIAALRHRPLEFVVVD